MQPGKFATALTSLVTLSLLTHHLGADLFGVIAVIQAVVTTADLYANFNTWQAIVRYGTQAIADQRDYPAVKAMAASQDYIEGPKAFSEKRPPKWVGK